MKLSVVTPKTGRAMELNRAYELGCESRLGGPEVQRALFIAEYGIDLEAIEQFDAGAAGHLAPNHG